MVAENIENIRVEADLVLSHSALTQVTLADSATGELKCFAEGLGVLMVECFGFFNVQCTQLPITYSHLVSIMTAVNRGVNLTERSTYY